MAKQTVPAHVHHKPTGQGRVRIDGRDHYTGKWGTVESKREYNRLIGRFLQTADLDDRDREQLTVGQLAVAYLEFAKGYYRKGGKPTGHLLKVQVALRYLTRTYRKLPAVTFGPKKLAALREQLIDDGRARNYINDVAGVIKRAFKWGAAEELIPVTVYQSLLTIGTLRKGRTSAREPSPVLPVADVAVEAIRPHVPDAVWGLIQFQRWTGCRPGEALIVRGCDLNMSGPVWEYTPSAHKTEHHGKRRVVMIGPEGQRVLREYLRPDLAAYLFSPDPDGARPYRTDSYINAVRRGCELAFGMPDQLRRVDAHLSGLEGLTIGQRATHRRDLLTEAAAWRREHVWTPNQLRHSFATKARRAAGLEAARVTLGHASAAVSEVYAERDFDAARAVVARIG